MMKMIVVHAQSTRYLSSCATNEDNNRPRFSFFHFLIIVGPSFLFLFLAQKWEDAWWLCPLLPLQAGGAFIYLLYKIAQRDKGCDLSCRCHLSKPWPNELKSKFEPSIKGRYMQRDVTSLVCTDFFFASCACVHHTCNAYPQKYLHGVFFSMQNFHLTGTSPSIRIIWGRRNSPEFAAELWQL